MILERSFGRQWLSREFTAPNWAGQQRELAALLAQSPTATALSSHTLLLPTPPDLDVFPILFIRHPLRRLKSGYDFERVQNADTMGSRLARATDFAGYIRARMAIPHDRACRDFQTWRLAMAATAAEGSELQRAQAAIRALPFIGLVEAFDRSVTRLEQLAAPIFPGLRAFPVIANAAPGGASETQSMRELLGEELFANVLAANAGDLALYELARSLYPAAD